MITTSTAAFTSGGALDNSGKTRGTSRGRTPRHAQTWSKFHRCVGDDLNNLWTTLSPNSGLDARFSTIHRPYYFPYL